MNKRNTFALSVSAALCVMAAAGTADASSHREAPFIAQRPKVDGTDFYMFRSYETGRDAYVTFIANYDPLQDAYGGPNYFTLDPNALYEIEIDNNGDNVEDITFQFRPTTVLKGLTVPVGGKNIPVPLSNIGAITASDSSAQNVSETYTLTIVRGTRRSTNAQPVLDASGSATFTKPIDNIGNKSIADYATYANSFIHTINIPGCATPGKVFVGQRKDGFVVNLGETFDLVNIKYPAEELDKSGTMNGGTENARNVNPNTIADKNVTSFALEVPIACLTAGTDPVIGAWTTASIRQASIINPKPQSANSVGSVGAVASGATGASVQGGSWTQVSRLGAPLVNELVIGLPDKDLFNASEPKNDAQFADYVTNPSLPVLLQVLFGSAGVKAPNVYPRADLIEAFLTGVPTLNEPANKAVLSEMLRLNTSTAIPMTQNDLGVIGGDSAGFPNGRRPIDDVVDIELRVAMGVLLSPKDGTATDPDPASDASRGLHYTDGAEPNPNDYLTVFPYLNTPIAGSPNPTDGTPSP